MQGRDRVHCLTRWRLTAPSGNDGGSVAGRRRWSRRFQAALAPMACTSVALGSDATRAESTRGNGLLEGSHLFSR
jgi:hypothetical protein